MEKEKSTIPVLQKEFFRIYVALTEFKLERLKPKKTSKNHLVRIEQNSFLSPRNTMSKSKRRATAKNPHIPLGNTSFTRHSIGTWTIIRCSAVALRRTDRSDGCSTCVASAGMFEEFERDV